MRLFKVMVGLAILAYPILHTRPHNPAASGNAAGPRCDQTNWRYFCEATTGLTKAMASDHQLLGQFTRMPDQAATPGAINPNVSQANIGRTICRAGYARSIRPAYALTKPLKARLMQSQHPGEPYSDYELDHLIALSIGGAPADPHNLWLQPRHGIGTAADKDRLEYVLWRLVCAGEVPLAKAQHDMGADWVRAYRTYATPQNLARFHSTFGENDDE